jgi:uncharacterized protein
VVSTFFVDTSALAKRYLVETGSNWVLSWIEPPANNVIVISELAFVEMRSLLARRVRESVLRVVDANALRNDFLLHANNEYLIVLVETNVLNQAARLVDQYPLRTLDAIQLASAIQAVNVLGQPMLFISGDKNLLAAVASEGFVTDDPNAHP